MKKILSVILLLILTSSLVFGITITGGRFGVFLPTDLPNCEMWLDAADISTITLNGANVSQWRDKSGNAHDIIQETEIKQPLYSLAAKNGKNIVDLDGLNDTMLSNEIPLVWKFLHDGSPYTILAVINSDADTPGLQGILLTYDTSSAAIGVAVTFQDSNDSLNHLIVRGVGGALTLNTNSGDDTFPDNECNVAQWDYEYDRAGNDSEIFKNGTLISAAESLNVPSLFNPYSTLYLGSYSDLYYYFKGFFCEILIYTRILSPQERNQLTNYLSNKWGI